MFKKTIIRVLVVLILIAGVGRLAIHLMSKNLVKDVSVSNVEFTNLKDGEYTGSVSKEPITVQLKVIVKDSKVSDIVIIEHKNGLGKDGEKVIEEVLSKQSLNVDTISGATTSSKIILKAIENALMESKI